MPEYNLTTKQYSKYYATIPIKKGARGARAKGEGEQASAVINRKLRNGEDLPGVKSITMVGRQRLLRVSKKVYDTYEKIISQ